MTPNPGADRRPTAAGFIPVLVVNLVLFGVIALVVTRRGEQVIAWSLVGVALTLLLLVLGWELAARHRDRGE